MYLDGRLKELMAFVLGVTMETAVKSATGLPGLQHQPGDEWERCKLEYYWTCGKV